MYICIPELVAQLVCTLDVYTKYYILGRCFIICIIFNKFQSIIELVRVVKTYLSYKTEHFIGLNSSYVEGSIFCFFLELTKGNFVISGVYQK